MSTVAMTRRSGDRTEWQSFLAVLLVTILAVGAGLVFLNRTGDQSRRIERSGITVDLPTSWIVADAGGDLILSAYDPLHRDERYTVAAPPAAGRTPEDVAHARIADRRPLLSGFAILEEGPAKIGDVATYRVRYTFAGSAGTGGLVEVREDYVADGNRVLVVGLEAPPANFAAAESAFEPFARQALAGRKATGGLAPATAVRVPAARLASVRGTRAPATTTAAVANPLVAATVQVFILRDAADPSSVVGWGSGTIISADGLILTNAHVAKPTAGGLGVQNVDPSPETDPAGLVIGIIEDEAKPAVPRYRASVIAADGYLDAALVRIDRTVDGAPVAPGSLHLPFLPIGDSDALHVGDKLTVVGFPGIGGDTVSLSAGEVSGFLGDSRLGARAWIKTDAVVSQGNSGGVAANAAGELIGLPTLANPNDTGGYSLIRPVAFVKPMIAATLAGHPSLDSAHVVASTGRETMTFDTWTDKETACQPGTRLSTYPSGTRQLLALFKYSGMADGEDILSQWSANGQVIYRSVYRLAGAASAGGCLSSAIFVDRSLPDGAYRVEMFAGPNLKPMATAATSIGSSTAGGTGSSLSGRIIDVDSGQPIPNAGLFLLTPGTDPDAWLAAPSNSTLVGVGETGSDGRFTITGLTPGTTYPAVAAADGYRPLTGSIGPVGAGASELGRDLGMVRVGP